MKKLFSLLCLAACVFCMTACASNKNTMVYDEATYKAAVEADLQVLSKVSDAQIMTSIAQYGSEMTEVDLNLFTKWMELRPELGEYIQVLAWDFNATTRDVTIIADVDYSLRDAEFEICYLADGTVKSAIFRVNYTLAEQFKMGLEKLPQAGLNTVIGMGVVFIVLILISLLIGCFKYINKFEQAMKNKKEKKSDVAVAAVDNTIAQIVQKEEEELVDDLELVAVIAAAIAAYTGTSTDGFVVRSIKKSNKNKWRNA